MACEADKNFIEGYMCLTDYECELGVASGGIAVYSSLEDVLATRRCTKECGVVKVAVSFIEVVLEPQEDFGD